MSLPSGYTRLEYIESTGTQYVDTGFRPNQDSRVICDYQLTSSASGQTPFMGRTSVSVDTLGIFYGDASTIAFDYGTNRETDTTTTIMSRMLVDFNKNNVTYNGKQKTLPPATFQSTATLTIFARHTGNSVLQFATGKLYVCQIYDNGTIIRDFIPCKNASGVVGMWDDVNSQFYTNAGTGAFTAGPPLVDLPAHKTLINGTAYEVKGGKCLVNGTSYAIKKGRTLIGGTGYDITLPGVGTRVSTLRVGQSVYAKVNGAAKEFIVVHQGNPSSLYDESCNGTWLLMKDIYENRKWDSSNVNKYESSDIHIYLNNTFLNLFESNIRDAIKQVKLPYRKNGGSGGVDQSGANGLSCKVFLLSGPEVGLAGASYMPNDGAKLDYFNANIGTDSKRIAYLNGSATFWWLRSPDTKYSSDVGDVLSDGDLFFHSAYNSYGIRPALILRSDALVDDEFNIIS